MVSGLGLGGSAGKSSQKSMSKAARLLGVLTVGFAAMFYRDDKDGIAEIVKANAVVATAEAELRRLDILDALNIAFASGEITRHCMQDVESDCLVNRAKVGFGRIGSGDFFPHRY